MENMVDAAKMVLAVLVFAIACVLLFRVASTARASAEFVIAEVDRDGYLYMEDSEYINNGNRLVNYAEVWANINNYYKQTIGITIVKDNKIIARFDANTEDTINEWVLIPDETEDGEPNDKEKLVTYYDTFVNEPAGLPNFGTVEKLEEFLKDIYNVKVTSTGFGCPWHANYDETVKRIGCEMNGTETKYQHDTLVHKGVGLNTEYGLNENSLFTEIIVDTNDEYTYSDEDRLWTGDSSTGGTLHGVSKKEYIYICWN